MEKIIDNSFHIVYYYIKGYKITLKEIKITVWRGVIIMIILTIENVPGKEIKEVKGLVKGSTVRCKNIGRDITASFKNLVGGEMSGYNDMLTEARQIAIGRMVDEAEAMGANAIIGMKLMSSAIAAGAAEMVAYGTAVVVE